MFYAMFFYFDMFTIYTGHGVFKEQFIETFRQIRNIKVSKTLFARNPNTIPVLSIENVERKEKKCRGTQKMWINYYYTFNSLIKELSSLHNEENFKHYFRKDIWQEVTDEWRIRLLCQPIIFLLLSNWQSWAI